MISIDLNLVWTIINIIVLYLLLKHFLIGPVTNIMDRRRQMIEDGFKNAQAAQDDANRLKQEYEEALKGAKQESVRILENARTEAKSEYDRIVGEAGERAGSIIESAKETVRMEREQTMNELRTEIAGLAVASAGKILGRQAGSGDDQNLYDQFLEEVGEAHEDTEK